VVSSALRLFILLTDLRWFRWELIFSVMICCKLEEDHGEAPAAVGAVEAATQVCVSSLDLPNRCTVFQVILLLAVLVVECEWFVQPFRHFKWAT
jgi:hypothetical protein